MADPIPVPVGILRLPRGPDSSGSRGFQRPRDPARCPEAPRDPARCPEAPRDPARCPEAPRDPARCPAAPRDPARCPEAPRDPARCPEAPRDPARCPAAPRDPARCPEALQRARAALRERFLRLLGRARGKRARFRLCTGLGVLADFGAADVHSGTFQVDSLLTPLGVQDSALLRCGDVLEFSIPLE